MNLYSWFTKTYSLLSFQELKGMLDNNVNNILKMIDAIIEKNLFESHQRIWADDVMKKIVWKFINLFTLILVRLLEYLEQK